MNQLFVYHDVNGTTWTKLHIHHYENIGDIYITVWSGYQVFSSWNGNVHNVNLCRECSCILVWLYEEKKK